MTQDITAFKIKQVSIFSENKPGKLATVAKVLKEEGINILAFSIAEGAGYGVIRTIVDKPDKALEVLTKAGLMVRFTDVMAVEMFDRPGGLYELTQMLKEANINIEYAYAYRNEPGAILVIRVEDIEKAILTIKASGAKLLDTESFR